MMVAIKTVLMEDFVEDNIDKVVAMCSFCNLRIIGGLDGKSLTKINPTEIMRAGLTKIFAEKDKERKTKKLEILLRDIYEIKNKRGENLSDVEIRELIGKIIA